MCLVPLSQLLSLCGFRSASFVQEVVLCFLCLSCSSPWAARSRDWGGPAPLAQSVGWAPPPCPVPSQGWAALGCPVLGARFCSRLGRPVSSGLPWPGLPGLRSTCGARAGLAGSGRVPLLPREPLPAGLGATARAIRGYSSPWAARSRDWGGPAQLARSEGWAAPPCLEPTQGWAALASVRVSPRSWGEGRRGGALLRDPDPAVEVGRAPQWRPFFIRAK